jgi:curved DNA-binding protein CbpA
MAKDYYLILGIGADATEDEIKSAYRREAKRHHPDCSGEDCEPFLALQEAYEVLGDPERRRAYDRELARERRQGQPSSPWCPAGVSGETSATETAAAEASAGLPLWPPSSTSFLAPSTATPRRKRSTSRSH